MAAKDLYEKDLYKILGVSKNDNPDAVKKAYRKLAKDLHPDKTKGDKKLEDRFKEVSEAYEVLSDDKKRAEYDEMRDAYKTGRIPQGGPQGGYQSSGNFQDIFGGGTLTTSSRHYSAEDAEVQVKDKIYKLKQLFRFVIQFLAVRLTYV